MTTYRLYTRQFPQLGGLGWMLHTTTQFKDFAISERDRLQLGGWRKCDLRIETQRAS